jgi:ABC-type Fe3+/spermidine/putrescine transport system ATPase subunit
LLLFFKKEESFFLMPPAIELLGISKDFSGSVRAVDDVSLAIAPGHLVCLLGSSGCGKTTLLRIIAGLDAPSSGRILVEGRDITDLPARERPMRMMFQDYALFPHMSVAENIAFGLTIGPARRRLPKAEIQARVERYLDMVQLTPQRHRKPHALSGGQRQRVALARALATEPPVVLFDEPLGSLDAGMRRSMQAELRQIHARLGKTFVFVTHDQEEALSMSDRIGVMRAGRLLQYGSPEDVYERPQSRFVAQFLGRSNFLAATVQRAEPGAAQLALLNASCSVASEADLHPGQRVTVMFRANHAVPAGSAPAGALTLEGSITQRRYFGDYAEHTLSLHGGEQVFLQTPPDAGTVDGMLRMAVPAARLHVLVD